MKITQVDAFTSEPFAGNPAAVCVLPSVRPDAWMQQVAQEMNLSETAFVLRRTGGGLGLRWFTPAVEVDLCGHATLAAAHVLWEEGHLGAGEEAVFHTRSGILRARPAGEGGWIALDFPAEPAVTIDPPDELTDALRATPVYVGKNRMDYLVVLEDEAAVRQLEPDLQGLERLGMRGFIVTAPAARADAGYDFVSRFFAPRFGIPEDPVTGSAHCCLGPYWSRRLGRDALTGYQASARGGTVRVRTDGERIHLSGQAVTVLRGELIERA